jgi:trimeric autotransporter adhesin
MKSFALFAIGLAVALVVAGGSGPAAAAVAGDERWDFRFGRPGADSTVLASTTWNGRLFIGGGFVATGGSTAKGVAWWDGTDWRPFGDGLEKNYRSPSPSFVVALASWNGGLFAGGDFTRSGTNAVPGLARWDGAQWLPVGGLAGAVYALDATASGLYVAGGFSLPGDTNLYGVARWDGQAWEHFGSVIASYPGNTPRVTELVVDEPRLYAVGDFYSLGGQPIQYSAQWTGTNWQPAFAPSQQVWALTLHQGRLCGSFYTPTNPSVSFVGWWDGTNWNLLGNGLGEAADHLISDGTNLFAAGGFTNSGSVLLDRVAKWDGTNWLPLGTSVWARGEAPYRLAWDTDGRLLALGYFLSVQGQAAAGVAVWDGWDWSPVGPLHALGLSGLTGSLFCLATNGSQLYAGGLFTFAGRVPADVVAVLESNRWSAVGQFTVSNQWARARALAAAGSNLYVGGRFTNVEGRYVSNLAGRVGGEWSDLGGGVNSNVYALALFQSNLVVGGDFTQAGSAPIPYLAAWDGAAWAPLGTGADARVRVLAPGAGLLYAGGYFTNAGGKLVNRVAAWDGARWDNLGAGVGGSNALVLAIAADGPRVFVGGRFQTAGGQPANNVACWDGAGWRSLGEGAENGVSGTEVDALLVHNGQVFVGGNFTNAGTVPVVSLARWDGNRWAALGAGLNHPSQRPRAFALAWQDNALWVGGLFNSAGNKGAAGLARWIEDPALTLGNPDLASDGCVRLRLRGTLGLRFTLETSSALEAWRPGPSGKGLEDESLFEMPRGGATQFFRGVLEP